MSTPWEVTTAAMVSEICSWRFTPPLPVEELGGKVAGLYDGSWSEWGARADCPVATGPATTP